LSLLITKDASDIANVFNIANKGAAAAVQKAPQIHPAIQAVLTPTEN
jgi:hypothetical protein